MEKMQRRKYGAGPEASMPSPGSALFQNLHPEALQTVLFLWKLHYTGIIN